jgi:hypothetical protein
MAKMFELISFVHDDPSAPHAPPPPSIAKETHYIRDIINAVASYIHNMSYTHMIIWAIILLFILNHKDRTQMLLWNCYMERILTTDGTIRSAIMEEEFDAKR